MKNLPTKSEIKCEKARRSLWEFCKLLAPDFYKDDRPHLKILCDKLQYRKKNLLIQMPPRHGKSRTLIMYTSWLLGKDERTKIISASYNDDLAQDFSRYTRDTIQEERNLKNSIVYSDIFDARIKHGDASYKKWALEGQFFNYKGTGTGGSITGRGGNIIIDDPVKDAETAYNELALEKLWRWYTGTLISRKEENAWEIICMTPWAKLDIAARVLELEPDKWEVLTMPVIDEDNNMLCPEVLSYESYVDLKNKADPHIFAANYMMERLDIKGRLYSGFKTYSELPADTQGIVSYTDTADEGDDYLCTIVAKQKDNFLYVTDLIFTQEAQEITEPAVCTLLLSNEVKYAIIESNNGGRGFARNVQRLIHEKNSRCAVRWFHQSANKRARILTEAPTVQKYVLFPEDWATRWPQFYSALMSYQKEGKNKHDDAPDCLTGLVEKGLLKKASITYR